MADGRDTITRRDRHFGTPGSWCSRSNFRATKVGNFDTELVREWFQTRSRSIAGVTFARRDPIWRETVIHNRRILLQGVWQRRCGAAVCDRSARRGRSAIHQGSASAAESLVHRRRGAMPVYTVHAPATGNAGIAATDRFRIRFATGFYVWATLSGRGVAGPGIACGWR